MDALLQADATGPAGAQEKFSHDEEFETHTSNHASDILSKDQRKRRKKKEADHRLQLALSTMHSRLHRAQERQEQLEKINWQLFCDNQALRQTSLHPPCSEKGGDAEREDPQMAQHKDGGELPANTDSQDSSWMYDPLLDLSSHNGYVEL